MNNTPGNNIKILFVKETEEGKATYTCLCVNNEALQKISQIRETLNLSIYFLCAFEVPWKCHESAMEVSWKCHENVVEMLLK